jgi:hypothetical protein
MSEYPSRHEEPPDLNPERNKGEKFSTEPTGKTTGPAGVPVSKNPPIAQNQIQKSLHNLIG